MKGHRGVACRASGSAGRVECGAGTRAGTSPHTAWCVTAGSGSGLPGGLERNPGDSGWFILHTLSAVNELCQRKVPLPGNGGLCP